MICNNSNISVRNNQAFSQVFINQVNFYRGSMLPFNIPNKIRGRQKFTDLHAEVIDWLVGFIGRSPNVFVGYEYIAKETGISIDTVEVAILRSVEMKALVREKYGRGYKYSLGEFFLHEYVIQSLRWVIPSLYFAAKRVLSRLKSVVISTSKIITSKLPLLITNVKKVNKKEDSKIHYVARNIVPKDVIFVNAGKLEGIKNKFYSKRQQAKYKLQGELWKKESEQEKLKEEQAIKAAASKRWRDAVEQSRHDSHAPLRSERDIAKIQESLQNAASTITGGALSFLKYLL